MCETQGSIRHFFKKDGFLSNILLQLSVDLLFFRLFVPKFALNTKKNEHGGKT